MGSFAPLTSEDVFADLGSGRGAVPVQVEHLWKRIVPRRNRENYSRHLRSAMGFISWGWSTLDWGSKNKDFKKTSKRLPKDFQRFQVILLSKNCSIQFFLTKMPWSASRWCWTPQWTPLAWSFQRCWTVDECIDLSEFLELVCSNDRYMIGI